MIEHLSNAIKTQFSGMNRSNGEAKFATISSVNYDTGNVRVIVQPDGVLLRSISLFDGLMITETDGLPASASRLL
jgi:hypothetical protein